MAGQSGSKRKVNIELLRIVSMLEITALHYLYWNDAILLTTNSVTALRVAGSILESLCIPSVACYVLISGYCDRSTEFRIGRLWKILAEVWVYSVVLHLFAAAMGLVPLAGSIWELATYILPIMTGHYWFATAFVVMEIFAPLLNAGVEHVSRKTLKYVILALLIYESVIKTVLPFQLNQDAMGYDFGFFLMMFLIGAWLRRYGAPHILNAKETVVPLRTGDRSRREQETGAVSVSSSDRQLWAAAENDPNGNQADKSAKMPRRECSVKRAAAGYLTSCAVIAAVQIGAALLHAKTGSLSWLMSAPFHYNYLFAVSASVCLFLLFTRVEVPKGRMSDAIRAAAPLTFGVYLIQCHSDFLQYWPTWLSGCAGLNADTANPVFFFLWMLIAVAVVYAACSAVDAVRKFLFERAERLIRSRMRKKA